jgi:peptide/nickel transport system substrate-binding protein
MHILSQNYAHKVGEAGLSTKPLGSGPFCLAAWHRGVEIDLSRNKYFWLRDSHGNRLPYLDSIRWMIIKDDQARAVALQSGQVQVDTAVSPAQVADLQGASSVVTEESPLLGTIDVLLNHRYAPLQDLRVRQALNYAVDRPAIVKAVFFGHARPALSPLYLANYTTEQYGYGYDLAKARQLMAASHFPHGFTVSVTYQGGDATGEATLTILKDEWAQIGVKLQLAPVEQGVLLSAQAAEKWQMFYQEGTNDVFDPAENLPYLYGGKAGGSDSAYTHYFNPTLWRLIQQAGREFNSAKRAALYNQVQKVAMGDAPNVLLVHPDNIWAVRSNVHGFVVYKTGLHPFLNTWLSK